MTTYKKIVTAEPGMILGPNSKTIIGTCTAYQDPATAWKSKIHRLISGENPEGARIVTLSELQKRSQIERNISFLKEDVLLGIEAEEVEIEVEIPHGWVNLQDGKFLYRWYGKYMPDLLFINAIPEHNWQEVDFREFNLGPIGDLRQIRGRYFKTQKGANAFEASSQGPHVLLGDNWGGSFNSYRGENSPKAQDCLYQRLASSNRGGSGTTFSVVPIGYKAEYSVNEL